MLFAIAGWAGVSTVVSAQIASNPYVKQFTSNRVRFELQDELKNQAFTWPRTLLRYLVDFSSSRVRPEELELIDVESGLPEPFQLSDASYKDGQLLSAKVNFFSALPSGGHHVFELRQGMPLAVKSTISEEQAADALEVNNGVSQIRIPKSAHFSPGSAIPGPIMALNRGSGWVGECSLVSPKRSVLSLQTEKIEVGPLFVSYRLTYHIEGGGTYTATIRVTAGYEYFDFAEEMQGLSKEDGIYVENAWTDYHPTHRMTLGSPFGGVYRIDEPIVQPFRGEDPAFTGPSRIEDVSVEMLPSLTPYWPNGWGGNREAAFWDEKSGLALGLFITDVSKWQDHEYAIWTSAETLKVKYRYANGILFWKWPLVTGTRQTGVTIYHHLTKSTDPTSHSTEEESGSAHGEQELPCHLRIWYGDLNLNRVKDWVLTYPDHEKRPAFHLDGGRKKSVEDYMNSLPTSAMTRVADGMFHPVGLRDMSYWVVPGFDRFEPEMTPAQRSQATAYLLFAAYVSAEDEFSPMLTMLGGHPNFMADLKFPLAAASALFSKHPMANEWREQYEKFIELCGHYYVRPAVPAWEALGGRWTESIATYNWAFLAPTLEAGRLNLAIGGRNFYATPAMGEMGDYLAGILTAPVTLDPAKTTWPDHTPLNWENGFQRIHPPQGAHSSKRVSDGLIYKLGEQMENYQPLTAEHLMWGSWPGAGQGFEDRNGNQTDGPVNHGTNPHLTSAKYNGYGIVLRAGVDTPDEVSVYLQQIDKGPNYRWGYANQNGCGDIYYYAQGKSFSGHEREEAGDGHVDDAMFSCNTGVYKNWHFSAIGMNELTRPLYNLKVAQLAEIVPAQGPEPSAWPEYQSRSVMLVGTDYIITYDQILPGCGSRFSWAVSPQDEMPLIYHLRGADGAVDVLDPKTGRVRGSLSTMIKGGNSQMALVTHKKDVEVIATKHIKGTAAPPYFHIRTSGSEDYVFQNDTDTDYSDSKMTFNGKAGVIRFLKDGQTQLALFHGMHIGTGPVSLTVDNPDLGISTTYRTSDELSGQYFVRTAATLSLTSAGTGAFYVDGSPLTSAGTGTYKLPAGSHHWQMTARQPEPMPPVIVRTENHPGGAKVFFTQVAGAQEYRLELSTDAGLTWNTLGKSTDGVYDLTGQPDGSKVHLRVIAVNTDHESSAGDEYPIYISLKPPPPPDGLKLQTSDGQVKLTWGQVLGPAEYHLYRRDDREQAFQEIFHGLQNEFTDRNLKTVRAYSEPGLEASAWRFNQPEISYEYAVSASNANGEGKKSVSVNTRPDSWLNWNPDVPLRFKRQSQFWLPPWVFPDQSPPLYYPE